MYISIIFRINVYFLILMYISTMYISRIFRINVYFNVYFHNFQDKCIKLHETFNNYKDYLTRGLLFHWRLHAVALPADGDIFVTATNHFNLLK